MLKCCKEKLSTNQLKCSELILNSLLHELWALAVMISKICEFTKHFNLDVLLDKLVLQCLQ